MTFYIVGLRKSFLIVSRRAGIVMSGTSQFLDRFYFLVPEAYATIHSRFLQPEGSSMKNHVLAAIMMAALVGCGSSEKKPEVAPKPFNPTYANYAAVLQEYVQGELVDYSSLASHREGLDLFIAELAGLSSQEYSTMNRHQQMALWINAYNGITLRSIIDHYPVKSIKDIDGVWNEKEWDVAGRKVTLNGIENDILRPQYQDPRIHFALNCASIGCPPLPGQPFLPSELEQQLDQVAASFVNNPTRTRFDADKALIHTSELFTWFEEDFITGSQPTEKDQHLSQIDNAVLGFLRTYADEELTGKLDSVEKWSLVYESWDWSLNDVHKQ
jgi:hypothetical protein